jgi:hypothetical protein
MIKFTFVQSGKLYKPEHRVTGFVDGPNLLTLPLGGQKREREKKLKKPNKKCE